MRWETSGCVRNAIWAKTSIMKYFVSPNFPMKFPDSASCTWKIRTAPHNKIKIMWEVFWMDGCEDGNQLIVHDVKAKKHKGPYCGVKKPPVFFSSGNEIEVTLKKGKTPHPQNGRGVQFMVGYQAVLKTGSNSKGPAGKGPNGSRGGNSRAMQSKPVGNFDPGHNQIIQGLRGNGVASRPSANGPPARAIKKSPSKKLTKPIGIQANASGRVMVGHYAVSKSGVVTYQRPPPVKIKSATSNDVRTAPNSGSKPQGPTGKNGASGGMVNGKCVDPPDMGCNNKNWKPHTGTSSSQPIDLEHAPDGLDKINMTALAAWVGGVSNVQPTPGKPTTRTSTSTTSEPEHQNIVNLWESNRRVPDGLAVVYGSDWSAITDGNFTSDAGDDIGLINDEEHLRSILSVIGSLLFLLVLIAIGVRLFIFAQAQEQQKKLKREAHGRSISEQHLVVSGSLSQSLPGYR